MRKRLIPVLLLDGARRLVKTERFGARTYIGDPFNVVRLFNEKEVDEIAVLDIDAGPEGRRPDLGFMKELASECFMPLSYGGGIRSVADCEELNRLGVEKFVLGQAGLDSSVVRSVSDVFGSQAVVVCIDVVGGGDRAHCVTGSGRQRHSIHPLQHALDVQASGAGEIILQSVDRDGTRSGMDLELIRSVSGALDVPVVALGGAGDVSHLVDGLAAGASAVASGSAFSFIGRLRAVLVTYPSRREVDDSMARSEARRT